MWREANLFGIYFSPLPLYALVALLVLWPVRLLLFLWRLDRFVTNPSLLQVVCYLCILAALVTWF